ncbi:Protein phosphatase methylesterase 1 [Blattella germanica]|nr:Protein phosphatase methylesterase 1 [Blattella germanica]
MSTLQKTIFKAKLPPIVPVGSLGSRGCRRAGIGRKRDYTPVLWNHYFNECHDVSVNGNKFRVYSLGNHGPLLVLLHGGGFSALTWSLFSASVTSMVGCQVLAIDLRGHGDSVTTDEEDLSAETMSSMGGAIAVHTACANYIPSLIGLAVIDVVEGTALDALASMQSFLRGRPSSFTSLEHAIEWCVRSAQLHILLTSCGAKLTHRDFRLRLVLELVEQGGRQTRPSPRESDKKHWPTISNTRMNCTVCYNKNKKRRRRIQTKCEKCNIGLCISGIQTGKLGTNDIATYVPTNHDGEQQSSLTNDAIHEEDAETSNNDGETTESASSQDNFKHPASLAGTDTQSRKYVWRIDLARSEKYWSGWFKGLSQTFLSCPVPKMLLLAGIDRLDKDLTVGQMQGKFQLQVLPQSGHAVQEDVPDKVAEALATFMVRHKFAEPEANFERTFPAC